jgi:hypothetical protein
MINSLIMTVVACRMKIFLNFVEFKSETAGVNRGGMMAMTVAKYVIGQRID